MALKFSRRFRLFVRTDRGIGTESIIEGIIMFGLGIVGLSLLAGAGKMAWSALTGSSGSEVVMEIAAGVHQVTTIGNYGTGDLTSALVTAKSVPSNIVIPGNTSELQGPTGTSFFSVTGNFSTFSISLTGLADSECMKIVQQTTSGNSWVGVSVNGSNVTQPVTIQMAQGVCTGGTDSITWISD
ncbi:MAG: type 4 pilus major pilin [Leptospirales bacterium]